MALPAGLAGQNRQELDSLQRALITTNSDTVRIFTLNRISRTWMSASPDSAIPYSSQALALSESTGWREGKCISLHQLGNCYYLKGELVAALQHYEQSFDVWKEDLVPGEPYPLPEAEQKKLIALGLNNIGMVYFDLGNYTRALNAHLDALRIYEQAGDERASAPSFLNIGNVYVKQQENEKSRQSYLRAMKILEAIRSRTLQENNNLIVCYGNIGSNWYYDGHYVNALNYYSEALKLSEKLENKHYVAAWLNNIGNIHTAQHQYDKASASYRQALETARECGNTIYQATSLIGLGDLYTETGRYAQAEPLLLESIQLLTPLKELNYILEARTILGRLYEKKGDYRKALEHHKEASVIKDSLFTSDKKSEITRNMMNYEFEKKEAEQEAMRQLQELKIKSLGQRQRLTAYLSGAGILILITLSVVFVQRYKLRKAGELARSEQKRWLSLINPHFIANSMSSIRNIMHNNPGEAAEFTARYNRMMRDVLDHSTKEIITLGEETGSLVNYLGLEQIRVPFQYKINIAGDLDADYVRVPPLLMQPIAENAIRHGIEPRNDGKGFLIIDIYTKDNRIYYRFRDNGVGIGDRSIPEHRQERPSAIRMINERLALLTNDKTNKLQIHSTGEGTEVLLHFPKTT